jgi:hypothetical protein
MQFLCALQLQAPISQAQRKIDSKIVLHNEYVKSLLSIVLHLEVSIANARIDIPTEQYSYPEKFTELLQLRNEVAALQKNEFL